MAAMISTICCTLIILAFCQVIIEAVLPEGGTRRFVVFLTGLITVAVITAAISMSGRDLAKIVFSKSTEFKVTSEKQQVETTSGVNLYTEYFEKLVKQWK